MPCKHEEPEAPGICKDIPAVRRAKAFPLFEIYRVIGKKEYSIMLTNEYLKRVYEGLEKRKANEP